MNQFKVHLSQVVSFKIVSNSPALYSRWLPLLIIEIFLNWSLLLNYIQNELSLFFFFSFSLFKPIMPIRFILILNQIEIYSLETIDLNETKEGWDDFEWPTFKIVSDSTVCMQDGHHF
jgi:hypothetical protein